EQGAERLTWLAVRVASKEEQVAIPAHDAAMLLQTELGSQLFDAGAQRRAARVEHVDHAELLIALQGRKPGRDRMCFRSVRRGKQEHSFARVGKTAELHQLAAARKRGETEAVRERLAPRGEVRR